MEALILFSHGSVLCGAGEALNSHVNQIRSLGTFPIVEVGYLNYSEPTFFEAVETCRKAGATVINVLPFFLVPGYFVSKALPEQIAIASSKYPQLSFQTLPAIGYDTKLADILIQSAQNPMRKDQWRDGLSNASRHCGASPACPLYATPDCPRVPAPQTPARPDLE